MTASGIAYTENKDYAKSERYADKSDWSNYTQSIIHAESSGHKGQPIMTSVSNRPVPDGYTEEWDSTIWNVGFIFRWSNVYECWLDCEATVTVKPGQTLSEAYTAYADEPMWNEYTIFFANEH